SCARRSRIRAAPRRATWSGASSWSACPTPMSRTASRPGAAPRHSARPRRPRPEATPVSWRGGPARPGGPVRSAEVAATRPERPGQGGLVADAFGREVGHLPGGVHVSLPGAVDGPQLAGEVSFAVALQGSGPDVLVVRAGVVRQGEEAHAALGARPLA